MNTKDFWPDLTAVDLGPTLETLHLWAQVVGKVRLALTPWENHGWHVPLYVSARGLATGLIPAGAFAITIEFDLIASTLLCRSSSGAEAVVPLTPMSLAAFFHGLMGALDRLGVAVRIDTMPAEMPGAVRFGEDNAPRCYDADVACTYWRTLVQVHRVLQLFRTRFLGKCSPVHLFWGAFDLAVTRFSGRIAPRHPGGVPHMPDAVAREAYSREVSSAGFWPNLGAIDGPAFYSYAYPTPAGFEQRRICPAEARFETALGEFLLPYAAVRAAADPDAALLDFLQDTYVAAADLGGWDRTILEGTGGLLGRPPEGS